ncbi:MAG: hypothetical protein Q9166_007832 [cf. Caloplaca sp. 2 TL-2023]
MAYRVELAASNRAICKNTECKNGKVKIGKNELRFGVWVDYGEDRQGWAWRHWGCVTPAQLASLQDKLEGDVDMLDGYEEIPDDCQEKVKRAVENGHVDDEDWKGQAEGQEGQSSPAKSAPKKRRRAKKEDLEDDNDEEPARKRNKAPAKKGKMIKNEVEGDETDGGPNAGTSTPTTPKGKRTKAKDATTDLAAKQKAKTSAKKAKAQNGSPVREESDMPAAVPEKTKAAGRKGKKARDGDDPKVLAAPAQPAKVARRPRKAEVQDAEEQDLAMEHEEQPVKTSRESRATKNTANTKKPIAKKTQKRVDAVKTEEPKAEAPRAKRGRKKANM